MSVYSFLSDSHVFRYGESDFFEIFEIGELVLPETPKNRKNRIFGNISFRSGVTIRTQTGLLAQSFEP